jgi:hypothetical protein
MRDSHVLLLRVVVYCSGTVCVCKRERAEEGGREVVGGANGRRTQTHFFLIVFFF